MRAGCGLCGLITPPLILVSSKIRLNKNNAYFVHVFMTYMPIIAYKFRVGRAQKKIFLNYSIFLLGAKSIKGRNRESITQKPFRTR